MATDLPADMLLTSLQRNDTRPLSEWTTTFQLAVVALDPYTHESSWILPTATRVLRAFAEADCRTAFLMGCDAEDARRFLGPLVDELLVLVDPEGAAMKTIGIDRLPALVHIDQTPALVAKAEGWNPGEWREVVTGLARVMSWQRPPMPVPDDPVPFDGTPSIGAPAG